jgi:hypothetical protein
MATIPCGACGCHEHAELLAPMKPSGKLECIGCAGPGWQPMTYSSIAKSVCDHLTHLYDDWMEEEIGRRVQRLNRYSDALARASLSLPTALSA